MYDRDSTFGVDALLERVGWMRQLARSLLPDAHSTDDVMQQAWYRLLTNDLMAIGAGSLLDFALSEISFPVGRVRFNNSCWRKHPRRAQPTTRIQSTLR